MLNAIESMGHVFAIQSFSHNKPFSKCVLLKITPQFYVSAKTLCRHHQPQWPMTLKHHTGNNWAMIIIFVAITDLIEFLGLRWKNAAPQHLRGKNIFRMGNIYTNLIRFDGKFLWKHNMLVYWNELSSLIKSAKGERKTTFTFNRFFTL